jgi:formyltetrahydrofolate hydrolase
MIMTRMLLPAMAMTSQALTQNQTPWARRKVAHKSPVRLMSHKKSHCLRDLMETT